MSKRVLSILMAIVMVSLLTTGSTSDKVQAADSARANQVITALGIMKTDDTTKVSATAGVKRAQFAQMLVSMSSYRDMVSQTSNVSLFKDVSKKYWAASYIKVAITEKWMSAYLNGNFKPNQYITLQEAVNAIVTLLGYSDSDFSGNKNAAKLSLYYSKNLDENIKKTKNQKLTRTDCMNLFYNTLTATTKTGGVYGTTLGYTLDSNGDIDYLSLVNKEMDGPIVAGLDWKSQLPFSATGATYYRNSASSSMSSIQQYDVLYYSETMNTVWAYSDKVSGTVETISPSQLAPTSVTIAGNVLTLGTQEMSYAFSTLGTIDKGDVITVLLGKEGSVVGYLTQAQYAASVNGTIIKTGEMISDLSGSTLKACNYVTLVNAAGRTYTVEYAADDDEEFVAGGIISVTYSGSDAMVDNNHQRFDNPIEGKVNAAGTALGSYAFAKDINILDVQESQYKTVYPSRLAGVQLYSTEILYYHLNSDNQIDQLILKNVTGDLDSYGILLGTAYTLQGGKPQNTYTYSIGTVKSTYTSSDLIVSLVEGPARMSFDGTDMDELAAMSAASVGSVVGTKVATSDGTYLLSDEVVVYYLEDSEYSLTTLAKVSDLSQFNLTAYYDKTQARGGRVRVIVAQDK